MEMKLLVQIKSVYGVEKIYPINEQAAIFAGMLKQLTLTRDNIESIKRLGYVVEVMQNPAVL